MPLPPLLERALEVRGHLRIAHRGAPSFAIDNTDRAILKALEHDPDLVEVDVHRTLDGALILWHDRTLEYAGQHLVIANTPLEQLRQVRFADGSQLVTLEEAMLLVAPHTGLLVDLKADGLAHGIINAVQTTGLETVVVCGNFLETLRAIKALMPDIGVSYTPEVVQLLLSSRRVNAPFLDALTVHWRAITPALLENTKMRGVRVIAWTVDEPDLMRTLIRRGVSGITTNRIEVLATLNAKARAEIQTT